MVNNSNASVPDATTAVAPSDSDITLDKILVNIGLRLVAAKHLQDTFFDLDTFDNLFYQHRQDKPEFTKIVKSLIDPKTFAEYNAIKLMILFDWWQYYAYKDSFTWN